MLYETYEFAVRTDWMVVALTGVMTTWVTAAPRWENESVFRVNKEPPHATKMAFPTADDAMEKTRMESPWCLLLNGAWKYHWSPTVEEHDASAKAFFSPSFDDSEWGTIPVPSNVELQGYGTPIYRSAGYAFVMNPPRVTDEPGSDWTAYAERSPVSAYRRTFTVPDDWAGRNTFITFNGVDSAFAVYVNGQEVGYSQDSRTPAEFNITTYLKPGQNLLAVEVYRWSDGSYLEDQDMWRLSGIFRDVYLWSAGELDLRDIKIRASLDDTCSRGVLALDTFVHNYGQSSSKYMIEAILMDAAGQSVVGRRINGKTMPGKDHKGSAEVDGLQVRPWSAEHPYLYTLQVALKDESGKNLAFYAFKVGFVRSEIKAGNLLVNGKPVLIKGVDRHDHHHITGHYITEETMRSELNLMKNLNINAIRTAHYPNDPRFLELVNEYGFYVISEANVETHGFGADKNNRIANDGAWRAALIDRVENMVETFKNQPCIMIWSLGNEAGTGPNFEAMADWVHERDPSRPVHYEGATRDGYRYVDFESPMYYPIGRLDDWCRSMEKKKPEQQKPLIQCEYSHAMGNSCGGMAEYWELIRKERLLQGGFIWDWRDQGILKTRPANPSSAITARDKDRFTADDGSLIYFAYGGDFGDYPNDNNFCMNGVVGADLVPNPHAAEVAYQYRSILTTGVNVTAGRPVVKVFNENFFVPLRKQPLNWTVLENGEPVKTGQLMIDELDPQGSVDLTVPVSGIRLDKDAEYFLNVEYPLTADCTWAPAGTIIARDQLALEWTQSRDKPYRSESGISSDPRISDESIVLASGNVTAEISKKTGQLVSYRVGGREYLKAPLMMNFWRPPADNDRGSNMHSKCAPWRTAGTESAVRKLIPQQRSGTYEVTVEYDVPVGDTEAFVTYTFHGDGALGVALRLNPDGGEPELPRVGFQCAIDPAFTEWSWYGRGPEENYSDRNTASFMGLWSADVRKAWFPYHEPQETANRTGVQRAMFSDGEHGLTILSNDGQPLEVGAYPFLQSDLEGMRHPTDIPLRDLVTVQITHRQMGVGGENSWGAWPRPAHILRPDESYEYAFVIQPF